MAYTSIERSLNARGQPRDKAGRWVTTGAALLGDFIDADGGQFRANNLRAIGGSDEKATKIRAYVANNDYADRGLKEGDVIEIEPKNAELQTGTRLDRNFLKKKGIDPDVKHTLPDDVASQPQKVSDLNIQKASDLDKEMALGGLTDEEDAEFRKEREAEPLAKLPPALAEEGRLGEEELKDIVDGKESEESPETRPKSDGKRLSREAAVKRAKSTLKEAKKGEEIRKSDNPDREKAVFEQAIGRELTKTEANQLGLGEESGDTRKRSRVLNSLDRELEASDLKAKLETFKKDIKENFEDDTPSQQMKQGLSDIKEGFKMLFNRGEKEGVSDAESYRRAEDTRRAESQEIGRDDRGKYRVRPRKPRSYPPKARTKAEKRLEELNKKFGLSPYDGKYKDLSDEELIKAHKGTEPYMPPAGQIGMDVGAEREKELKRAAIEAEMRERGIDPLYARGENLQELYDRKKERNKELKPFEDTPDIDPPAEDLPEYDAEQGYRIPPELNPNGLPPYGPPFPGRELPKFEGDLLPPEYRDDEFGWPAGAKTAEEAIEMQLRDPRYRPTPKTPEQIKRFEQGITDPNAVTPENYDEYLENKAKLDAEKREYYAQVKDLDGKIDANWDSLITKDADGNLQGNFDRDKWNELKAQVETQRAAHFELSPDKKGLYDLLGVQDLWNRAEREELSPKNMQRLRELEDMFRDRRDRWDEIQNKVGAPINVGMDDIFFDDDDSSMDLEEPQEPVLDTTEEPKVKTDPENPGNPVGPPSEKNTEEKLEAEKNADPVEEETPKKSIDEIEALGTAEEYVEDFDGLTPSEEQTNILNAIVKGKFRTVVKALAGTGKTTTLVAAAKAIARRRPGSRILSLQFNRKNAQEAGERMPRKNSEAVTVDAFAFRSLKNDNVKLSMNPTWQDGEVSGKATSLIGQKKAWVLANDDEVAKYFTYDEMPVYDKNLNATQVASMVRQIVDDFSHGTDDEITEEQVKKTLSRLKPDGDDVKAPSDDTVKKFKKYSDEYWENITSDKKPEAKEEGDKWTYEFKRVRVSNSHITKMWALSKPDLSNYRINDRKLDTIFFDEGQDAIPAVAKVLADQDPERVQVIHVGDPNQAIYEWRGAINALDRAGAKADAVLPLTTVRRFGPELAGPGNAALNLLGYEEGRVRALGEGGEVTDRDSIPVSVDDDTVVLTRSNAGGIGEIAKFIAQDKTVGVTTEFYEDIESAVFHLKWLGTDFKQRGKTPTNANGEKVINSDLAGLRTKKDLYQLAENDPESRAAKYKILFERLGGGNFDAGVAYVEQNILPGIVTYSDGERPQNKVSGDFTGKVGENAVVSEDSRGNTLTLSVDENFIKLQGPSAMYTHELKNGDSLKTFLKSGGWKPHRDTDGKWYYRISVKNYSEARRARDLNAVFDQIPEHLRPKDIQDRPKPDVKVSTTHRMKGLEADNVIIGDDFPEPGTLENGEQELPNDEELRTAYVALTRARNRMSLGSLGWVRDFQGPEGVAAANKAKDRDANVGAEAWKTEGLKNVAFSPSNYMSDDDLFDDLDDGDVEVPDDRGLPEFDQNIRTTRRTNVEDIDPDAEDGAYIVDPETGKNVRITSSDGDDENVFLDGYDEDNEDYQATFPRGQKVNQIEFGEPVRRQPEPEPERPEPARPVATPEPKPIARKPEPGKKASQIEEGDELLDDDGNVIGKVTGVRKGKLGDGTKVVAVEHDGPEKKVVYERSEDVKLRRPGKPATPEQAEEDKQTLIDDIKGDDGTDLDVPPELLDTPSFVETWVKTKNGTYSKYFGGERWNVKENKDGTITLRPRSNSRDSKKYGSWEELEADFDNQVEESFKINQEELIQIARDRYGPDSYLENAIKSGADPEQLARLFERDDAIQDALGNGDLSIATLAARFNRYSDSFQARKGRDPLEEIIPDRKRTRKDYRPDPDAPTTPAIEQEDERRQEESDRNKERAEELERDATDEDEDYADEVEEDFTPAEEPLPESEEEDEEAFEIPEGKVVTPAGLIDEDLNRPDDGSDITERSPFSSRLADLPDDEGMSGATPEQIKQQLMEEYPAAKIREDGAIVIHRKTYKDDIGPDAGKDVKVELFVKETKNNTMVIGVSKEVDGEKETYYHYNDHNSLKSLTRGGGVQGAAGIEQQLDRLTRTESDIDSDMAGKSAQAIRREKKNYGGASGYFNYMRRNREAALNGAGGNQASAFKLRTPEEHAQMVLNGRADVFQSVGSERYKKRFGKKASIYEAFQSGDQEQAAAIYQQYVNSIPDTPEAKERAKNFFEQSMREKFPAVDEEEMSEFLSFADSRVDSKLTAVDKPRETHLDRQGKTLRVGDYVEWTNNEGEVSRGQVVELKAVENPNEGAYAYSDYAEVKFLGKTKPQALNTNNMTKADDQESPVNNYQHWVRNEELAYNRKDKIGWEYDEDNKLFYWRDTGEIVKDFRADERTPGDYDRIQGEIYKKIADNPELNPTKPKSDTPEADRPSPEENEAADDTANIFDGGSPVPERRLKKIRSLAEEIDDDSITDPEDKKTIEEAKNPKTLKEFERAKTKLQELYERRANLKQKNTPVTPTEKGVTGKAAAFEGVDGFDNIPRYNGMSAFRDDNQSAEIKDSNARVLKPTPEAEQEVDNALEMGEDIRNRAAEIYEKNYANKVSMARSDAERYQRDANDLRRTALLESDPSRKKKLEKESTLAQGKADRKNGEADSLVRRSMMEALEEQGVEFNKVSFADVLKKATITQNQDGTASAIPMSEQLDSDSVNAKAIDEATKFIPRPVLEQMKKKIMDSPGGGLYVGQGGREVRGFLGENGIGQVFIRLTDDGISIRPDLKKSESSTRGNTALHELWHLAQSSSPDVTALETAYLYRRAAKKDENGNDVFELENMPSTATEQAPEKVLKGTGFSSPYTGRMYGENGGEPGLVVNSPNAQNELGTTLIESMFGIGNDNYSQGSGRYAVARDPDGSLIYYLDSMEGAGKKGINAASPRVKKGYYNEADGKWYEDSAFSNPVEVVQTYGRPKGEADLESQNFLLGMMLRFGKRKSSDG